MVVCFFFFDKEAALLAEAEEIERNLQVYVFIYYIRLFLVCSF